MGGIGSFFNSLTQPLGVRLFPGGPYADAGYGDQYKQTLQYLPGLIGQEAEAAGVRNPFTMAPLMNNDPYRLYDWQQHQYNSLAGNLNQGMEGSISALRQRLYASGITDPRASAAAEARVRMGTAGQLTGLRGELGQQAFNTRMNTLGTMGSQIGALAGGYQNLAQNAMNMTGQANSSLGSLLGLGIGSLTGGGGLSSLLGGLGSGGGSGITNLGNYYGAFSPFFGNNGAISPGTQALWSSSIPGLQSSYGVPS